MPSEDVTPEIVSGELVPHYYDSNERTLKPIEFESLSHEGLGMNPHPIESQQSDVSDIQLRLARIEELLVKLTWRMTHLS